MRLSKSRFTAGWQCHRRLWWTAHEPGAPELVPDVPLEATRLPAPPARAAPITRAPLRQIDRGLA